MSGFYGGKRCVITKVLRHVEWSHLLDAALESSNTHVSRSFIISCTMILKMRLLACRNGYPQIASESISPTRQRGAGKYCAM